MSLSCKEQIQTSLTITLGASWLFILKNNNVPLADMVMSAVYIDVYLEHLDMYVCVNYDNVQ